MTENIHPWIFQSLLCCGGAYGNISKLARTYVIAVFYVKRNSSHYKALPSALSCFFLVSLETDNSRSVLQYLSLFINNVITQWAFCEYVRENKRELIQIHLNKQFLTSKQSISQSFQFVSVPGSFKVVKESDSAGTPFQRGVNLLKNSCYCRCVCVCVNHFL